MNTDKKDQHKIPKLERHMRPDGTTPGEDDPPEEDADDGDLEGLFDDVEEDDTTTI
ncbi:hypothetical protein [Nocardiopsis sp. NPDC057823]|uniref:hypothetical protein n=1 Tax=Nocardiopsis sp. NPDC057823 TaxID=3346256 RepID=UPI00366D3D8E